MLYTVVECIVYFRLFHDRASREAIPHVDGVHLQRHARGAWQVWFPHQYEIPGKAKSATFSYGGVLPKFSSEQEAREAAVKLLWQESTFWGFHDHTE